MTFLAKNKVSSVAVVVELVNIQCFIGFVANDNGYQLIIHFVLLSSYYYMISKITNFVKGQGALLAVDHGSKYLGLALADERINIAMPFGIIDNKGEEYVLTELKKIISEKDIIKIIIGRPLALSGNVTEQTKIVDEFVVWLKNKISVPIEIFDERFTSKMSATTNYKFNTNIRITNKKKKNNAEGHDAAAAIFLQDYLESQNL